jgi:hypothetical protein
VRGDVAHPEVADQTWRERLKLVVGPIYVAPVLLVATQLAPYTGEDSLVQAGDIAERPGFRLRHARFGVDAGYTDQARARVSIDVGIDDDEATVGVHDAWAAYTPLDLVGIYAGAHSVPFSRFALIASGRGALIERPLAVRALAPMHQVGGTVQGRVSDGLFTYGAGVFNALARTPQFYEGYVQNYAVSGNRFEGLAFVGRVGTEPLGSLPNTAADEEKGPPLVGVGGNYLFSHGGTRDLHTAGGDVHVMALGFHGIVEGLWSLSVPESAPTQPTEEIGEVHSYAVVAEAGYMILAEMLGLTVRFEWIDPDIDSEDESDNWLLTGGAHFSFVERIFKLQAEYTHREELFGVALANDSVALQLQLQLDLIAEHKGGGG